MLAAPAGSQTIAHLVTVHEAAAEVTAVNLLDQHDSSTPTTSIVLDLSGATEGALIVVGIVTRGTVSITSDPWTVSSELDDGGNAAPWGRIYDKVAGASESSTATWSLSASFDATAIAIEVVGGSSISEYDWSTSENLDAVTVATGGIALSYGFVKDSGDSGNWTATNGSYVEVYDSGGGSGEDTGAGVIYLDQDGATNGTDNYNHAVGTSENVITVSMSVDP